MTSIKLKFRPRFDSTENIEVVVGQNRELFTIHKDRYVRRSSFFAAACSRGWNSSGKWKPIDLTDDDPVIFLSYLQCVQIAEVVSPAFIHRIIPVESSVQKTFQKLIHLHILADKLGDLKTANLIIDNIIHFRNDVELLPGLECIWIVFGGDSVPDSSPLQLLLVDLNLHEADEECLKGTLDDLPHAFLAKMVARFLMLRKHAAESGQRLVVTRL